MNKKVREEVRNNLADTSRKQIINKYKLEFMKWNKILLPILFLSCIFLIVFTIAFANNESDVNRALVAVFLLIIVIIGTIWLIKYFQISSKKEKELKDYKKK